MQALQGEDTGALCHLHHDYMYASECVYVPRTKDFLKLSRIWQQNQAKKKKQQQQNKVNPYCVVLVKNTAKCLASEVSLDWHWVKEDCSGLLRIIFEGDV